ncbi:MAG TPA: fibro-slime domain-containing protein [Solirubrobacter sp.]|nr:fibro-slime domain-containing protein [Solirubrobacter sp.]
MPALTRLSLTAVIAGMLLPATTVAQTPPAEVTLPVTLRDFRGWDLPANAGLGLPQGHEDFENASGSETGIVGALYTALGPDGKPVYAKGGGASVTTHGQAAFDQWYRDTNGINLTRTMQLDFTRQGDGRYRYENGSFFPLDGLGWVGLGPDYEPGRVFGHNFSFTTELRTEFLYTGQETVTFIGDDDAFVYVNRRLALDLGGVHGPQQGTVVLADVENELGLESGRVYDLDLFHAERHTTASNFSFAIPQPGFPAGTATLPVSARSGDTITCTVSGWPQDAMLSYSWLRDGTVIPGATAATLTVTAADVGRRLSCRVTGTRRTSAVAESAPLLVSAATTPTPTATPTPTPSPSPQVTPPPPDTSRTPELPCKRQRLFTIKIAAKPGTRLRRATVKLNGRAIKTKRSGRGFTARVDLRKRRPGVYTVTIRSVTTKGKVATEKRRYRIC